MLPRRFHYYPLSLLLLSFSAAVAETRTGELIYREMCASCHGDKGQGVAGKYDDALYGERKVESLARLIDRTMPEDHEDTLDAEGSALVAQYVYDAFYSQEARARNNPPRVDLARLTNRQYRETVADLVGSFQEIPPLGQPTGLKAEYFQSDGMNKKAKRILEREDPVLAFDFGEGDPVPGCPAEQFSIAWQGSLLVPDSGVYEFRVTTPNGARFYLNRDFRAGDRNFRDDSDAKRQPALIDEWVSSGETVREGKASVFLLGGRPYPVRLDYFKFKEKRGSVKVEWKAPHGPWRPLGVPYLSPEPAARVAVTETPFPPDDRSSGYERGTAISKDWHEATTRAALESANEISERIGQLAKTRESDAEQVAKVKEFGRRLAERAFRHPLTDEERALHVDANFKEGVPLEVAVKRMVLFILKSPRFLYPDAGEAADDFTAASRLALTLWDSLPDAPLREAAEKKEVHTADQLREQARRMMNDPRAKAKLRAFFHEWLAMDRVGELSKDRGLYPDFDDDVIADLRESLELFVDRVVWSDASDYRELLLADYVLMNPRLAKFYGVTPPAEEKFEPVKFDPAVRSGVFTHPYLLAAFSHPKTTSPIHRGVFVTRNVLGRFLKPPPQAVAFMDEQFDPSLTMREKVTQLTRDANCMSCHSTINPLGFALENYDAVGRWREIDNHKPVQAASEYVTVDNETVPLNGPRDLAKHASESPAARRGFIQQLFQQTVKQPPAAFGVDTVEKLDALFVTSNCNIRALMTEIAVIAASRGLPQ